MNRVVIFTEILLLRVRLRLIEKKFHPIRFSLSLSFFIILFSSLNIFLFLFVNLPSAEELISRNSQISTKIYDRNGVLLYKIYKDQNRTPVELSKIPKHVIFATLAAEDADFYHHPGFSLKGIIRSIIKNTKEKKLTGGSTITQQLVKNTLLSPEKTLERKIRELILSIKVENKFSKDKILEMYLNEVSYGSLAYGIQEAARVYFGKDIENVSFSEAAFLAGLPKSPTIFSPYGAHPESGKKRQEEVIDLMAENGFIKKEDAQKLKEEKLSFAPNTAEIKAPHFVMHIKEMLVEKYGEEMVEKGGLEVTTTLDFSIQQTAEKVVLEELEKIKNLKVSNAAVLILDTKSREVLSMLGSKDYFSKEIEGNVNVVLRPRSPGSSIKPVTYLYALSHGLSPTTIIHDSSISINIPGQVPYTPKNYDGKFRGAITLRSALSESRNIPAVRLITQFGVENIIEFGKKLGISSWGEKDRFGPSLTLGGGEVKLLDLANVYTTIANYGIRKDPVFISEVKDSHGNILENKKCQNWQKNTTNCTGELVVDPRSAFLIIDILKDEAARAPSFGAHSALSIPKHPEVAVKTGTSNDLRDNLTLGFNQKYTVASWVGNNDNSPMTRIASGVTGAAPIWNKIMSFLLSSEPSVSWDPPSGLSRLSICPLTGTLSCRGCPSREDWFLEENKPQRYCSPEVVKKIIEDTKQKQT